MWSHTWWGRGLHLFGIPVSLPCCGKRGEELRRKRGCPVVGACQHVPPGVMACEFHASYPSFSWGMRTSLTPLTLQFPGGSWIYAANCACKASLSIPYVPVWSTCASDAPEFATPQGILKVFPRCGKFSTCGPQVHIGREVA